MRLSPRFWVSLSAACTFGWLASACGGGGSGSYPNDALVTISTASVPAGSTGQAYAAQLEAVFPHPPGLFIVSAGRLPPGLELDNLTGAITGFPRQLGRFDFDISARDGTDPSIPSNGDRTFSEAVRSYSSTSPAARRTCSPRSSQRHSTDAPTSTSSTWPAGPALRVHPDGRRPPHRRHPVPGWPLGQLPTQANVAQGVPFEFDTKVTDAAGRGHGALLSLNVTVLPLIILTSTLPEAAQDFPCTVKLELASTGGGDPITWCRCRRRAPRSTRHHRHDGHARRLPVRRGSSAGPTLLGSHTFRCR
jgi:hypothetical protein